MKTVKHSVAISLLLLSLNAGAQHDPTYLGPGDMSCRDYEKLKRNSPEDQTIDMWLLGHVSGMNLRHYAAEMVDLLKTEDKQAALSFVLGYCASNGDANLRRAALEYWIQLVQRKR